MHIVGIHACPTEKDWICVILKGSTIVYYSSLGCLAKKYKLMFYMLILYAQNGTIIKWSKIFGVYFILGRGWISLQIAPKSFTISFKIPSLYIVSICV